MINFYKINTEGYPEVGSGKTLPQGYTEFTVEVAEDGSKTYSPEELNDAMVLIDIQDLKESKTQEIKNDCTANDPVSLAVTYTDGSTKTVTFNGGDGSAAAIAGAIDLAKALSETTVSLWDYKNVVHTGISLEEALSISVSIAKKYRDDMIKRQSLLNQIAASTTKEQLELITWN